MEIKREPFLVWNFALIVCKNKQDKFLVVKEARNRGWWIPGGKVDPGENFVEAAIRETEEEAGINIEIKGILRVEHSLESTQSARMRVIFYAEPANPEQKPKNFSNKHSEMAAFLSVKEIQDLDDQEPGHRGSEIIVWPLYVMKGGLVMPLSFFTTERKPVNVVREACKVSIQTLLDQKEIDAFKEKVESAEFTELTKTELKKYKDIKINKNNWGLIHFCVKAKQAAFLEAFLTFQPDLTSLTHKNRNCLHLAVGSTFSVLETLVNHLKKESSFLIKTILDAEDVNEMTPVDILDNATKVDRKVERATLLSELRELTE